MLTCRGEVFVWAEDVSSGRSEAASDLEILDDDERARLDRLVRPHDRALFCRAHAEVRRFLSRLTGVHPDAWVFGRDGNGKPEIIEPRCAASIRFNLTHTRGLWAVIVATGREVGIDAERIDRDNDTMEVAKHVLASQELASVRAGTDAGARRALFLEYWTLKESYLKARGTGLSEPLDRIWFTTPSKAPIRVAFAESLHYEPRRWQFELVAPTPRHRLAIAVSREPSEGTVDVIWMSRSATRKTLNDSSAVKIPSE